ncbi:nucleotidyltransferase domain-containing protein [Paenibacillus gansuensis]|uniref:Nucleotidyltransferase domain-containing protein n=1 Tax=Paenibacillus gansuensis TaxID=306542 RepID=A0ABW5PFG5_9BACL
MELEQAADSLIMQFKEWAIHQPDIGGIALVGSFARGDFHSESDVDLVIITTTKNSTIQSIHNNFNFNNKVRVEIEEWGILTSLRVYYDCGLEVEYGVVSDDWVREPLDDGTKNVASNGFKVILDKENIFESVIRFLR